MISSIAMAADCSKETCDEWSDFSLAGNSAPCKMQRGVITYMTFFMFTAGAERLTKCNLNTEVHTSLILVLTSSLGSADFRGHDAVVQQ